MGKPDIRQDLQSFEDQISALSTLGGAKLQLSWSEFHESYNKAKRKGNDVVVPCVRGMKQVEEVKADKVHVY